ncbi:hypothetical protein [Mesorhizobium sp. B3-2-1]|uniref:hypothetical protein n=1 Tax=Mesorhizobium sp. B3-2-1 TaxID=2589891 RepID=UPI001AED6996|nr:hypothetical protein [Mesorhizobium sp. B3-2-1]
MLLVAALPIGLAMGAASGASAGSLKAELSQLPRIRVLPAGVVQISPYVPGMGEHWANPANLPFGPIYCVIEGHITCMEYMISQKDFAEGVSHNKLVPWFDGKRQPPINHIDIGFEPNGHHGYEIPHYDIHMYFLSPEARLAGDKLVTK